MNFKEEVTSVIKYVIKHNLDDCNDDETLVEEAVNDILGTVSSYAQDLFTKEQLDEIMKEKEEVFSSIISNWRATNERIILENEELRAKISGLKDNLSSDSVKKELERKLAKEKEKNLLLKKLVKVTLEEL